MKEENKTKRRKGKKREEKEKRRKRIKKERKKKRREKKLGDLDRSKYQIPTEFLPLRQAGAYGEQGSA